MEVTKPTIELFVKAAPVGKEEKGPCPISQQWFMAFYVLVEKEYINLRVTPVNLEQPPYPENYERLNTGRKLPVAWVESGFTPQTREDITGMVAETNDEIEKLIDIFKCPNLAMSRNSGEESRAEKVFVSLYMHFNMLMKSGTTGPIETDLYKLDNYLAENQLRYLLGEELSYADCILMPKLQHIIVGGSKFADFTIPYNLTHVWRYIGNMYNTPAFLYSCPCDRDILSFYMDKLQYPTKNAKGIVPSLMSDVITNTVPEEVSGKPKAEVLTSPTIPTTANAAPADGPKKSIS